MENPWKSLPTQAPYLLPSDAQAIISFNSSADEIHRIRHELLPEPYLGRINAEIVLLNKNPGFSTEDHLLYEQEYAVRIWEKNILHRRLAYPFFLLDPQFENCKGAQWWQKRLRKLFEVAERKIIANEILCIEYFP
jgi:hypothetical protein